MLAVDKELRGRRIGTTLVEKAIEQMREDGADEVCDPTQEKKKKRPHQESPIVGVETLFPKES